MKLTLDDVRWMVFTRSRDVVSYMDAMAAAWEKSEIMQFDENRLHAMQALHEMRAFVDPSKDPPTEPNIRGG